MADKAVSELIEAERITATDLFVLEQNGTAKKLTGQVLLNWLTAAADGHGGIQSIAKVSSSGLVDTYRITLADTNTFNFYVTNGRSINKITKTATSGLVDTYTISYNDGNSGTFTVTNGEKGDKGDNAYIWVKYASQKPTSSSVSLGDIPDEWMGVYFGTSSTAPTSYSAYKWYQIKGEKGDTGTPATLTSSVVEYQVGDSGTIIPSGTWSASVPVVAQGKYLWTRKVTQFNSGNPITEYSVARFGVDGTGSVVSVNGVSPNENGNVSLSAADVSALPSTGGTMTGSINMNGQNLTGLNAPTDSTGAANKGYVDTKVQDTKNYANAVSAAVNFLDNWYFADPVNQRGATTYTGTGYGIDRWKMSTSGYTLTLYDGYISLAAGSSDRYFSQVIENFDWTKQYTLSVKTQDGTISSYSGTGNINFYLPNGTYVYTSYNASTGLFTVTFKLYSGTTTKIVAAKLEYGSVSTLANDPPPKKSEQLLECLRYYRRSWTGNLSSYGAVNFIRASAGNSQPVVFWEIPMRAAPTVTLYSWNSGAGYIRDWGGSADVSGVNTNYASPYGFAMDLLSGLTAGKVYAFHYEASADL